MTATEIPAFDTNILFYSVDSSDLRKQAVAQTVIRRSSDAGGVLSLQCLTEFYQSATKKSIAARSRISEIVLTTSRAMTIIPPSEFDLLEAMQAHQLYRIQFFDALMRSTIARAGATLFFSEDFSHGETWKSLRILNPFLLTPTELDSLFA